MNETTEKLIRLLFLGLLFFEFVWISFFGEKKKKKKRKKHLVVFFFKNAVGSVFWKGNKIYLVGFFFLFDYVFSGNKNKQKKKEKKIFSCFFKNSVDSVCWKGK